MLISAMNRTRAKRLWTLALAVVMALALSLSFGAPAAYAVQAAPTEGLTFTLPSVETKVYDDWSRKLSVDYYYRELNLTDNATATIGWRCGFNGNEASASDFAAEIVAGDSVSLSGATVTAEKAGTTVISLSGSNIPASNTAYVIIEVTDENTSELEIKTSLTKDFSTPRLGQDINQYDVIYFNEGTTIAKDFDVSAPGAVSLSVSVNGGAWLTKTGDSADFTAQLENRQNIIGVRATDTDGKVRTFYKTVDARFVEIQTTNVSRPGEPFATGDTASVFVKGIALPIWKIGGAYNLQSDGICFPPDIGISSLVRYYTDDYDTYGMGAVAGRATQYGLATDHSFRLVLNKAGTLHFTGGDIVTYWWGGAIGDSAENSHVVYGAPQNRFVSGHLPAFTIDVAQGASIPTKDIELSRKPILQNYKEPVTSLTLPEYLSEDDMWNNDVGLGDFTVHARVSPVNADNRDIVWTSSDEDIATVFPGPEGLKDKALRDAEYGAYMFIKPGHAGTATITASVKGTNISRSFTVNIQQTPIISSLSPNSIYPGDNVTVTNTNEPMMLGKARHAIETLTEQGASDISAVYRYDTNLPGMSIVDSGSLHFTQSAQYGAPIDVVNSFAFQVPNGTEVSQEYHLTGGRIVVKYTIDGEQKEQDVLFPTGVLKDIHFFVLDPDNYAVMPEDIYPGSVVNVLIGKSVPDNPTVEETNAAGARGNRVVSSTKHYDTNIPGLPRVETATTGSRTISFTVPDDTEPGDYILTNPAYYTYWQLYQQTIRGQGYTDVPIDNPQGMPASLTITVKEKPPVVPRYAYFDVERGTIGQGLFVEPVKVPLTDDITTVADLLDAVIGDKGVYPEQFESNYISGVKTADSGRIDIPEYIAWLDDAPDNGPYTSDALAYGKESTDDTLAERDYSSESGWMYSINNAFGGNGIKQQELNDGDVVRLAFTFHGWGLDLGASIMGGGPSPAFRAKYEFANFDELIKQMAEANVAIDDQDSFPDVSFDDLEIAYADAAALINKVVARQARVDHTAAQIEAILDGGSYTSYDEILEAAVDDALSELDTALIDYDCTKYTDTEWAQLNTVYENGKSAIADAETTEAAQQALDAVRNAMAAVAATKTDEVPAGPGEPSETASGDALSELDTALAGYDRSKYTDAEWAQLQAAYENGKSAIEAATTQEAVRQALDAVKNAMAAVTATNTAGAPAVPGGETQQSVNKEVSEVTQPAANTNTTETKATKKPAKKTVKIKFSANGGSLNVKKDGKNTKTASVTKKLTVGKKLGSLPKVSRDGPYRFKGWYTKKSGGKKLTKNTVVNYKKTTTLYARWQARYGKPGDGIYVVNVRSEANMASPVKGWVNGSSGFLVMNKIDGSGGWYKVRYDNAAGNAVTGYVYAGLVDTYWADIR